jgi:hypothetical protein
MIVLSLALTVMLLLAILVRRRFMSFRAQSPANYRDLGPEFDLRRHLSGPLRCEGVIYGPFGRVTSRFVADMHGRWDGNTGVLDEEFHYDSGATQLRQWRLTLDEDGAIRAEADDVVGEGRGRQLGPAVQMRYRLRLPEDSGGHVLNGIDWMYLTNDGTIVNRSQFRKFGIKVAELVASLRPRGEL